MRILFFKSLRQPDRDEDNEPAPDKMRRILESHVDEAKTDEEMEVAQRDLRKFEEASRRA